MPSWVLEGSLARSCRPGYSGEGGAPVSADAVQRWMAKVRALGIRSIICLLGPDQLPLYLALGISLPEFYRRSGFEVEHIPVADHRRPPLTADQLAALWRAYQRLPKPVLVHCSAGVDRTGAAIAEIRDRLNAERQ